MVVVHRSVPVLLLIGALLVPSAAAAQLRERDPLVEIDLRLQLDPDGGGGILMFLNVIGPQEFRDEVAAAGFTQEDLLAQVRDTAVAAGLDPDAVSVSANNGGFADQMTLTILWRDLAYDDFESILVDNAGSSLFEELRVTPTEGGVEVDGALIAEDEAFPPPRDFDVNLRLVVGVPPEMRIVELVDDGSPHGTEVLAQATRTTAFEVRAVPAGGLSLPLLVAIGGGVLLLALVLVLVLRGRGGTPVQGQPAPGPAPAQQPAPAWSAVPTTPPPGSSPPGWSPSWGPVPPSSGAPPPPDVAPPPPVGSAPS